MTGLKVARACPAVSHLLFTYDSLFFCKTNKEECQTILRILKEYEAVSGQQINFQKSSIQFGHKIEEASRQELRDILGTQNIGGMGSYLGLPESLGGSKVHVFGFVQDRLNNRVNGSTFRFFTKGGKEVIIIGGHGSAKPCYVCLSVTEGYNKKVNKCSRSVLVESRRKYKRYVLEILG